MESHTERVDARAPARPGVRERMVVGVDGSDTSRKALVWAVQHATRRGAQLDIVWAWRSPAGAVTPMGMAYIPPSSATLQRDAEDRLGALLEKAAHDCDLEAVEYQLIVAEREAAALLCEVAAKADLLVVGSRGLGGFKGLVLGSVSARCANASPCPVAVIPAGWDQRSTAHGVVLVGVDGSENANAAVQWADAWSPDDDTLRIVCAWSFPDAYVMADLELDDKQLEAACVQTATAAAALASGHVTDIRCVHDDARLVLAAEARDADVLVVGARGHSGFARLVLGSVASSVIHHLTIPTVLVRTPGDES